MGIASDFVLIVIAGLVGGLLARAIRLPLLVGYVAAGILVGPYTAGPTVVQIHDIELLAEIGVALLLFSLGLEISLRDLAPVRRIALIGGPIQIVATCTVSAVAGSFMLGIPPMEAVWLGSMISLSSTMIVLKTLASTGVTTTLASRVMVGLLVVQDLAVIPMLIILPQLANLNGILPKLARSTATAALLLLILFALGRYMLSRLLKWILAWGSRELFLVSVVAIAVGVGFATFAAGLSFALGAFVAGMVLSESEFSHQALSDVVPLRDIFGLIFFVTVGMLFDPMFVLGHLMEIVSVVVLIFAGKSLIIGVLTRAFGYTNMAPWIVGLGLSQIGEFSFVLARSGLSDGLLSKPTYDLALSCTVLTMALSPIVSSAALPLGRAWRRWRSPGNVQQPLAFGTEKLSNHVIVAGYGRTGRAVARVLGAAEVPFLIAELDHATFSDASAHGLRALWGDISQEQILRAAGIETARVLVLTVPDHATIRLSTQRARRFNQRVVVIARAMRERSVADLRALGVNSIVQPEFEGGIEMVRQALIPYEYEELGVSRLISQLRSDLYGENEASES